MQLNQSILNSAFYLLKKYIEPWDISYKGTDLTGQTLGIYAYSTNESVNKWKNGEVITTYINEFGDEVEKKWLDTFSKIKLQSHLDGSNVIYYRSSNNAYVSDGYSTSHKTRQKQEFLPELQINSNRKDFKHIHQLLLGFDIDAKNSELDALAVKNLILQYLPGLYWEKSTSGTGIHIYLKLAYSHDFDSLTDIESKMNIFKDYINELCSYNNYDTNIDMICGFPTSFHSVYGRLLVKNRAQSIKLPMLNSYDTIISFSSSPVYFYDLLHSSFLSNLQSEEENQQQGQQRSEIEERGKRMPRKKDVIDTAAVVVVYPKNYDDPLLASSKYEDIALIEDSNRRRTVFTQYYLSQRLITEEVTAEELNREYINKGVSNTRIELNTKRINDFRRILRYWLKNWNSILNFESQRNKIEDKFSEYDLPEFYRDGEKRKIKEEYIYLLYYALKFKQKNSAPFEYIKKIAEDNNLKGFRRRLLTILLRWLKEKGFIILNKNYIVGKRARTWDVLK